MEVAKGQVIRARNGAFKEDICNYIGVRKRSWGKWVSEIREPKKKRRIWLGSFECAEMAARAHDVAEYHFKGSKAQLNFPMLIESMPVPASSSPRHIKNAATPAAMSFQHSNKMESSSLPCGGGEDSTSTSLITTTIWSDGNEDEQMDYGLIAGLAESLMIMPPPPPQHPFLVFPATLHTQEDIAEIDPQLSEVYSDFLWSYS